MKNYGRRVAEELEQLMDCHVHIHRGSAYLIAGDDCRIGETFPGNNSLADIVLLCNGAIREKIENGEWETARDEMCTVNIVQFDSMIKTIKANHGAGFSKQYRDMPEGEFVKTVTNEMEKWMFIKQEKNQQQIKICPLAGKIEGRYPADFTGGISHEQ